MLGGREQGVMKSDLYKRFQKREQGVMKSDLYKKGQGAYKGVMNYSPTL